MIMDDILAEKFKKLHDQIRNHELMKKSSSKSDLTRLISLQKKGLGTMTASLKDIERGIQMSCFNLDLKRDTASTFNEVIIETKPSDRVQPYIKITLRKSDDILLYEQRSKTALRDTEEGRHVEEDNKRYEYLTEGKGKMRCTTNAVSQTANVLYKSRDVNTESIRLGHVASYVSNFEMFDTYKDLEKSTKSVDVDGMQKMQVTTYKVGGVDKFVEINKTHNFKLALMLTMRILAGNVFETEQRRFRNMDTPDPLATEVHYRYRLKLLWRYHLPHSLDGTPKAVADLSWCPRNGDIIAVAYGIYTYPMDRIATSSGFVCVWNIKNPVNPERCYSFNVPVVSVAFSPFVPQLLAVGLYDGNVEVRDISHTSNAPVATSERSSSPGCEPVIAIKWIGHSACGEENSDVEPLLALSQDGSVTKYRLINSPYLLGYEQIVLDRVEGSPEGLTIVRPAGDNLQANRHPQGLNLALSPLQQDIYYVLTDEGCMHKCSTNYTQQHLEVRQLHVAGVNSLDFSPWSPKLFVTCGNDWCIHIWMEGLFKPLITMKNGIGPTHCAYWSKTHSTILVALNRKTVDIWDLRRSTLKPVSSTALGKSSYTLFKFSNCGRSIAVGNESGNVLMMAFEDMPFPPHFQYKALESAILNAIKTNAELTREVRSLGHFGYPENSKNKAHI